MFNSGKRRAMADTIEAGAKAVGETSRAIAAIVTLSALALMVAIVAIVIALKGRAAHA
jgi:hypothetical protein